MPVQHAMTSPVLIPRTTRSDCGRGRTTDISLCGYSHLPSPARNGMLVRRQAVPLALPRRSRMLRRIAAFWRPAMDSRRPPRMQFGLFPTRLNSGLVDSGGGAGNAVRSHGGLLDPLCPARLVPSQHCSGMTSDAAEGFGAPNKHSSDLSPLDPSLLLRAVLRDVWSRRHVILQSCKFSGGRRASADKAVVCGPI